MSGGLKRAFSEGRGFSPSLVFFADPANRRAAAISLRGEEMTTDHMQQQVNCEKHVEKRDA
jgi:hypothetical protein